MGVLNALAAGPGLLGQVTGAINTLGNLPVWAVVVAITAVAIWRVRGPLSAGFVALSFASDLVAFAVKIVGQSARPDTLATEHFFGADSFGFPSGHAARAAALFAALLWVLLPPRYRLRAAVAGGLLAGAVMGYARVALGVHWPTDAIGGTLLGIGWFAVTCLALYSIQASRASVNRASQCQQPATARRADSPDSSWRRKT